MQPITTRVESVTLYHRGATVRRTAPLDLSKGPPAELFVTGLPLALVDHTLRARVESQGGALTLSSVRVGLWAPPRGTPELPPEEKEARRLRGLLAQKRDRIDQLEAERQRFAGVPVRERPQPEEGHAPTPSPMLARASLEALTEEATARRVELVRGLRDEVRKLDEELAAVLRKQQLASTATNVRPDELTKSLHVQVAPGATATSGTLVLEYFVPGARWAPAYQCRMTRDCRSADLQLRAMVSQRTGEDWAGVRLRLSTASPMSWTELPELSALRIGRAQPPPPGKRGFRPPPQGGASLFADYDRGLALARAARPVIAAWQPPGLELAQVADYEPPPRPAAEAAPAELLMDDAGAEYEEEAADERVVVKEEARMEKRKMSAPPPPPRAAPAPMMSARGAAPGGPAGLAMKAMAASVGRRADVAGELADEAPSFGAAVAAEAILYASLRLSAAADATRGQLTAVDRRRAFVESLLALKLTVTFDVLAVVEQAEAQGLSLFSAPMPGGSADVRREAGFYDYVYETDAAVDVPSDGTFHSVPVNTRTATGDVLYVAVPREDPQVYRQALVKNPLPSPLLPGPVEVYVAGEYVLTTALPQVAPGGEFKLSLGVEQAVKVARNTRYVEQRSGDKVVATNELIHDLDLELVNNLDREARFEVRERIPQPAPDAEVVVEEGKVSPPWEVYKQEERDAVVEGGRRWVLTVKPGATQALKAQYRVKLYANNELVGGNRREA